MQPIRNVSIFADLVHNENKKPPLVRNCLNGTMMIGTMYMKQSLQFKHAVLPLIKFVAVLETNNLCCLA